MKLSAILPKLRRIAQKEGLRLNRLKEFNQVILIYKALNHNFSGQPL